MPSVVNPSDPFDVAIVGGGINGAGIARDAAGRGAKVLLLERGDLASGTSSASTKLIHGGLRYLEHRAFSLVRESLIERETLWRAAPHLIQPIRFVLPALPGQRPRWLIRAGLFLYDHLGGGNALPHARSLKLDHHPAGAPLSARINYGFEYSDCWCDDSRLVIANARDAARRGATILTRHELTEARQTEGLWNILAGGRRFIARSLVNAAGPQAAILGERLNSTEAPALRLVRGSHIVVPALFQHHFAYLFQIADGRVVFAIPYERRFTLVGTTDVDQPDADRQPRASEDEIAYLLDAANRQFARKSGRGDVVWSYSGVRPLIDDGSGRPESASRGYRLTVSESSDGAPLLTVLGGKITTYRHLAERAADLLTSWLPQLSKRHWTASSPLPGGDFGFNDLDGEISRLMVRYPFLERDGAVRIVKAYGTEAHEWLGGARSWRDLGAWFGGTFTEAEARWMRDQEFALSAEDMLWRRSKLGLHLSDDQRLRFSAFLGEKAA